jgi:DNA ligase (NAD+)
MINRKFSSVEELVGVLNKAKEEYYKDGSSRLSDEEFDNLVKELKALDPNNAFFDIIEIEENSHWEKVDHSEYKMGSLNKALEKEEINAFIDKHKDEDFILQYKMDGNSLKLIYDEGKLISAATRGNGILGEEILRNVLKMKGIPLNIDYKEKLVIRAETILKKADYDKLPKDQYKNLRNACTGISKGLDGIHCEKLTVISHSIMNKSDLTELESIELLNKLGFETVWTFPLYTKNIVKDQLNEIYKALENGERDKLDYDVDGLVLKVNDKKNEGEFWHHPKHQMAYKFSAQYKATYIRDVEWNYEGSRITPVAIVEPTELAGATITRVTLHNLDYLASCEVAINDKIEISRSGEVIPKFSQVLEKVKDRKIIEIPKLCPDCGQPTVIEGAFLYCRNPNCSSKVIKSVMDWLQAHDSRGVAEATVKTLYENKLFKNLIEFLDLPNQKLKLEIISTKISGMGSRSCEILIEQIKKSIETNTMLKFYDSLCIENFGKKRIDVMLNYIIYECDNFNASNFLNFLLVHLDFANIKGIGFEIKKSIKKQMLEKKIMIEQLIDYLPEMICGKPKKDNMSEKKLQSMSFCFTGTLPTLKRTEAEKLVIDNGGEIKGVSKNLSYLVYGEEAGSKLEKAEALGIKLITEEEFLNIIK